MARRAYRPRNTTLDMVRRIRALDGVAKVDILAPHAGVHPTPARIKVTLEQGNSAEPASTIFSLPEARAWLASETETPAERMAREERSGLAGYHTTATKG